MIVYSTAVLANSYGKKKDEIDILVWYNSLKF